MWAESPIHVGITYLPYKRRLHTNFPHFGRECLDGSDVAGGKQTAITDSHADYGQGPRQLRRCEAAAHAQRAAARENSARGGSEPIHQRVQSEDRGTSHAWQPRCRPEVDGASVDCTVASAASVLRGDEPSVVLVLPAGSAPNGTANGPPQGLEPNDGDIGCCRRHGGLGGGNMDMAACDGGDEGHGSDRACKSR